MAGTGDLVLSSERVATERGIAPGTVVVRTGVIVEVRRRHESGPDVVDCGRLTLMPGVVDTHVHVNEPGRTDWEGFQTAGCAAAAGGITTMVVMPLNCTPAATTEAALRNEARAASGQCLTDFGLWGGVVPGNVVELEGLWRAGALGFKCFLSPSGVEDFENVTKADLEQAMPVLSRLGATLLVHAEDPATLDAARATSGMQREPRSYAAYLRSRPPGAEAAAIEMLIRLCRRHRTRVHIVHLATESTLPALKAARAEGLPITVETCPHYLHFAAEDIGDGRTEYKCAPPIRGRETREHLWQGLREGVIDLVASDHSPCPPELKRREAGNFDAAWGGISSLQLSLPVVWTEATRRGFDLTDVTRWMCEQPARLGGLDSRKGRLAPGLDADLVVFDPDAEFVLDASRLHHRHRLTPYDGAVLRGVVRATYVRGQQVFGGGDFPGGAEAIGRWLKRA